MKLDMWANAQRDGRPAEHRWRPLFNAANFGWRPLLDAARNLLKFAGVPQTTGSISAASGPKFTILCGHVEEILLLNKFFLIVDTCLIWEDIGRQSCAMVPRWRFLATFLRPAYIDNWKKTCYAAISAPHVPIIWWTSAHKRLRSFR